MKSYVKTDAQCERGGAFRINSTRVRPQGFYLEVLRRFAQQCTAKKDQFVAYGQLVFPP